MLYVKYNHDHTGHTKNISVTLKMVKYKVTISTGAAEVAYLTLLLTMQ